VPAPPKKLLIPIPTLSLAAVYAIIGIGRLAQRNPWGEIHIREEHAKSFNHDLDAMFADWQKRQSEGRREIVNLAATAMNMKWPEACAIQNANAPNGRLKIYDSSLPEKVPSHGQPMS
jgi:hypothetical protein